MITLRTISYDDFFECIQLEPFEHQKQFVASNLYSLAEAYIASANGDFVPMPYGIYAGEDMVGFIMLAYDPADPDDGDDESVYKICRLMLDKRYQGRGYARKAVEQALALIRSFPYGEAGLVVLSYKPTNDRARRLFSSLGFQETGEMNDDEVWAVLEL
ncbi:MAG: GNAT family N-acetyltransferase [Limnochordia bacterium]|jgi:diamine N-acetyltransferase